MERIEKPKNESMENKESKRFSAYLERIGRLDLENKITPEHPLVYCTMEMYGAGIKGQGGLGILAADMFETAKKIGMPATFYTLLYPYESKQALSNDFSQQISVEPVSMESRGYKKTGQVNIFTVINGTFTPTELDVGERQEGSATVVGFTEPNLGQLYEGGKDSDHRLYQEIGLGFGTNKETKIKKEKPAAILLNESATTFAALAELDETMRRKKDLTKALETVREKGLYTNHTLVQAADAAFSRQQFERFIAPNIENEEVKTWVRGMLNYYGGVLQLSKLAFALSGKRNGVSKIHAEKASEIYLDQERKKVKFEAITNGISMERWGNKDILALYHEAGIIDEFGLPAPDYEARIDALAGEKIVSPKKKLSKNTRESLKTRLNQYNQPVEIPDDGIIFDWSRRIAEYKRPGMIFDNSDRLARILETKNVYLVMAGKAHPSDGFMQGELKRLLDIVEQNPILKKRVHFVQNYDENLARALAEGTDVSLNTPRVRDESGHEISTEACGTSWMKKILGNVLLISTSDGGVADPELEASKAGIKNFEPPYFKIEGKTYDEEVASLYGNMEKTADIIRSHSEEYVAAVKRQLKAYLPIMSGSRMVRDYLNLIFPKE